MITRPCRARTASPLFTVTCKPHVSAQSMSFLCSSSGPLGEVVSTADSLLHRKAPGAQTCLVRTELQISSKAVPLVPHSTHENIALRGISHTVKPYTSGFIVGCGCAHGYDVRTRRAPSDRLHCTTIDRTVLYIEIIQPPPSTTRTCHRPSNATVGPAGSKASRPHLAQ